MNKTLRKVMVKAAGAAFVGVMAEIMSATSKKLHTAEHETKNAVPEAEEWVNAVAKTAMRWAADADVPEHVREFCRRVLSSEAVTRSGSTASKIVDITREKALHALRRAQ